jgi:hypothetical protein
MLGAVLCRKNVFSMASPIYVDVAWTVVEYTALATDIYSIPNMVDVVCVSVDKKLLVIVIAVDMACGLRVLTILDNDTKAALLK